MPPRRRLWPLALALACPAGAADLELGVSADAGWSSNVFSQATNPIHDYLGVVGLRIRAMDEVGALTWNVRYWPTYEAYLDLDDADGWNQDLDASVAWQASKRTRLRLSERYLDTGDVNQIFTQAGLPDPSVEASLGFGRDEQRTNSVAFILDHDLAARHSTQLSISRYDTQYEQQFETKNAVTSIDGAYLYALDRRDRLGLQLSATQQEIESSFSDGRRTRYYNASLRWVRDWDPTLSLNASAGPTWVDQQEPEIPDVITIARFPATSFVAPTGALVQLPTRASSCPRNGRGELVYSPEDCESLGAAVVPAFITDPEAFAGVTEIPRRGGAPDAGQNLTYFANIDLTKSWREYTLILAYSRSASTTAQISGVVRDNLSASLTWAPSPVWTVALYTYYERRSQPTSSLAAEPIVEAVTVAGVSDVAQSAAFRLLSQERSLEINDYYGGIFVNYALNRRTSLHCSFTYQYEELRNELARAVFTNSQWDRFYVTVGVTYTLPRFHLPF